ncbi:MAG: GNAT family N-acetyltransferase [Pirellula sp.]
MSSLNAIVTERLLLNAPVFDDANAIFETYASDLAVTAYVGWPRHQNIDDTIAFIEFANAEWSRCSIGPYLIRNRQDGTLLGSTGISCTDSGEAMTGYVLAKANWGKGFATEVVRAMIGVARQLELQRLFALCHPAHGASRRVLEKTGFLLDSTWSKPITFPNVADGQSLVPVCYRYNACY